MDYGVGRLFDYLWDTGRIPKISGDFLAIPVLLIGPPIALLLFGLIASWAFRGFKPELWRMHSVMSASDAVDGSSTGT